MKSLIR